ncbi:MarR family winged helix-turn-helix transcriptional regulator [Clostridium uliginosum]|uniref:DNA-binding transcriptional regulator, MarR family n=1 Tax=Clostridium uliginosum TaxID=119641 RepID=A0A1I1QUH9_9CLOT|nr:MarR family transcriptional regulator [Clostridium uliginosum]SFD23528.1 DNA-binding transcriptional regulator, MarR family [Clostridium uliginosum]
MNNENIKQIKEFSELWHAIIKKSHFSKIEEQFPRFNGLTTIEIGIISIVSKNPDVILREVGTFLDIPKSTLTNAIDRLEKRNYINRTISKRDRRSYGLKLTEEGHLTQKEHIDFESMVYGRLLNSLDTDEEKQELFKLLRKIVSNLEE